VLGDHRQELGEGLQRRGGDRGGGGPELATGALVLAVAQAVLGERQGYGWSAAARPAARC
jgi:hypothetical protein